MGNGKSAPFKKQLSKKQSIEITEAAIKKKKKVAYIPPTWTSIIDGINHEHPPEWVWSLWNVLCNYAKQTFSPENTGFITAMVVAKKEYPQSTFEAVKTDPIETQKYQQYMNKNVCPHILRINTHANILRAQGFCNQGDALLMKSVFDEHGKRNANNVDPSTLEVFSPVEAFEAVEAAVCRLADDDIYRRWKQNGYEKWKSTEIGQQYMEWRVQHDKLVHERWVKENPPNDHDEKQQANMEYMNQMIDDNQYMDYTYDHRQQLYHLYDGYNHNLINPDTVILFGLLLVILIIMYCIFCLIICGINTFIAYYWYNKPNHKHQRELRDMHEIDHV